MIEALIERFGEGAVGLGGGLAAGVLFGAVAQRSRFCMRSAVIEVGRGAPGASLAVWLLAVGIAIVGVQSLMLAGIIDPATIRMLNGSGSLSGAAIGGLLFGAGMVLTRGCVSRLMVLSASGNFRSVVTGILFIAVAYATMRGPLGEARAALAGLGIVEGKGALNLASALGLGTAGAAVSGLVLVALAVLLARRAKVGAWRLAGGAVIGGLVALAYGFNALLNSVSFDPQPVRGLSFIAPVVNTVAGLATAASKPDFEFGLVPGVLIGAFVAALLSGSLRLEWFASARSSLRYVIGAVLMGFGGVLAGGCSMGNGVSGWAIYSTSALVALASMWLGGLLADAILDRPAAKVAGEPVVKARPTTVAA